MKKFRCFLSLFLVILALFVCCASVFAAAPYTVNARAAMLVDLDSGQVLFEQAADELIYPASLTKIMTCMLALELGDPDDIVTVSPDAFLDLDESSSVAGLQAGEQLLFRDLLYCVMISSGNEACNVAAEHLCGSVEAFVQLMNDKARELGCVSTHFANPHGLHDPDHYTTARELARITMAALENPDFVAISTTTEYELPATNLSEPRTLYTTNYLVSNHITSDFLYPKARGIKTGFTTPAGRCLISMASSGDLNLLSVVCGAETKTQPNGDLLMMSFPETKALFEWGFSTFRHTTLVSPLTPLGKVPVFQSSTSESAVFAPQYEVRALLPRDYDDELLEKRIQVDDPDGIDAPVKKGQELGSVQVFYDGELMGQTKLLAIADIERSELEHIATQTSSFFQSEVWKWIVFAVTLAVIVMVCIVIVYFARARRERRRRADAKRRKRAIQQMRGGEDE